MIYSESSKSHDWPAFEDQIAEQVKKQLNAPVLIYLRIDDTPPRAHDPHRIAKRRPSKADRTCKQLSVMRRSLLASTTIA